MTPTLQSAATPQASLFSGAPGNAVSSQPSHPAAVTAQSMAATVGMRPPGLSHPSVPSATLAMLAATQRARQHIQAHQQAAIASEGTGSAGQAEAATSAAQTVSASVAIQSEQTAASSTSDQGRGGSAASAAVVSAAPPTTTTTTTILPTPVHDDSLEIGGFVPSESPYAPGPPPELCCICFGDEATHSLEPCGHSSFCGTCAMLLNSGAVAVSGPPTCPLCRVQITGYGETPVTVSTALVSSSAAATPSMPSAEVTARVEAAIPSDLLGVIRSTQTTGSGQQRSLQLLQRLMVARSLSTHNYTCEGSPGLIMQTMSPTSCPTQEQETVCVETAGQCMQASG